MLAAETTLALLRAADPPQPDNIGQLLAIASAFAALLGALAAYFTAKATGGKSANDQYASLTKDLRADRDDERMRRIAAEERVGLLESVMRHHVCAQFPHGIDPDIQSGPGRRGGTGGAT
jgi:hypothetical protein